MIAVAFVGSVIISPLYSLYQRKFGFSEIVLTLIYATYVVGNVIALLFFGQVSDQVGRKRLGLPTLALGVVSAIVFLLATGTIWLFVGRLLFGLVAGVLSGTGTAWLAEQYGERGRARATVVATTANLVGIAAGPVLGGCSPSTHRGRSSCRFSPASSSSSASGSRSPASATRVSRGSAGSASFA